MIIDVSRLTRVEIEKMKQYKKAGIVACSNGVSKQLANEMQQLKILLEKYGVDAVFGDYIYAMDGVRSGTAKQRANDLMKFYQDPEIDVIFDVSGGDIANEILPYLDFDMIADARNSCGEIKEFWGYSDLTVLLNAIYAKTGNAGMLYQVRNLLHVHSKEYGAHGCCALLPKMQLLDATYHFLQGTQMSGVVVGGNIRCLLKLAGTEYFPDMTDKILFLEARSGLESQMRTYLSQLQQMDVFEKISGLYLGTFTQWEQELKKKESREGEMTMEWLVTEYVSPHIPIAKTCEIGHALDSKALCIGENLKIS